MLVYQDKPVQLFDKKDGVMYELRVLHKDGEPYIDLTTVLLDQDGEVDLTDCIYGIPIKKLVVEEFETYDFNEEGGRHTPGG
jgi:hypothetical protein